MTLTKNEKEVLLILKDILTETECVYSEDLAKSNPKVYRGVIASLVKKDIIGIDDYVDGTGFHPLYWWNEAVLETITEAA